MVHMTFRHYLIFSIVALLTLYFVGWRLLPPPADLARIAHAGGAYQGKALTDSIEALNANASNYSLFELDFQPTTDGIYVCAHDWSDFPNQSAPSYALYKKIRSKKGHQDCTIKHAIQWLEQHPHARIVTDVKKDNLEALKQLASAPISVRKRFIPQIYQPEDFLTVHRLGFHDIIWTLYRYDGGFIQTARQAANMKTYAITMPRNHVWLYAPVMRWLGKRVYTHTVNSDDEFQRYRRWGVMEIYTDSLAPNKSN